MEHTSNVLTVKSIGINTFRENIIYMREDCHICRSEGFTALTRLVVSFKDRSIIATLNVVYSGLLEHDEAGLSREALKGLNVDDGDQITITHLKPIESLSKVRAKIFRKELDDASYNEIISDIVSGKYSHVELAAFVTALAGNNLTIGEITSLTNAMIQTGQKINWNKKMVLDKHCIGGLPGNRTTPIVVSIIAAAGLTIPKTSSKAITSPAGTADTMACITDVELELNDIKKVVEKENGCLVWGGAVQLSPADDILISVEKALDVDGEGQMIASVLSKKAAAGSTHVLIDIPVGKTAKVRSEEEAIQLQYYFRTVGEAIGLNVSVIITDGSQPVGRGIGPALEAIDVLSVLRNEQNCPLDLKERALILSGQLIDISGIHTGTRGYDWAKKILETGEAFLKFKAICEAQGNFREPEAGKYYHDVFADVSGTVLEIDNRKLARLAKLAGAPKSPGAGVRFHAPIGKKVVQGDLLFRIYADAKGELEYSKEYLINNNHFIKIV